MERIGRMGTDSCNKKSRWLRPIRALFQGGHDPKFAPKLKRPHFSPLVDNQRLWMYTPIRFNSIHIDRRLR